MIQVEKEVYIGYVVVRYLNGIPEIIPTTCTYGSKVMALDAIQYIANKVLYDINCEIVSRGTKKFTIKWQRKSLNH